MEARNQSKRIVAEHLSTTFILACNLAIVFCLSTLGRAESPATWKSEFRVGQFECHSDFAISQFTKEGFQHEQLVNTLRELPQEIAATLSLPTSNELIHVVLFQERDEYLRYMRNYFPQIPERRAIFIQDRGPGMLFTYIHKDFFVDLRHEMTHALLNQSGRSLPLWLDEGIAEYFEADSRGLRSAERSETICRLAENQQVPSLEELEKCHSLADFTDAKYEEAWAWVHFLLHRNVESRDLLVDVLRRYRAGEPQPALSRRVEISLPEYAPGFIEHFRQVNTESTPKPFARHDGHQLTTVE